MNLKNPMSHGMARILEPSFVFNDSVNCIGSVENQICEIKRRCGRHHCAKRLLGPADKTHPPAEQALGVPRIVALFAGAVFLRGE